MADIIKNVFKYGELRRTIFLNAHNKDDYGRHRGQVLYGMNLSGSGTVLQIAPGALYTSQGQRLFFDATDGVIDIGPATLNAFGAAQQANYPICVLIYLGYQFDTARIAKGVDVTTAVGQDALFTLTGRVVPFDLNTAAPTYNLLPRDPVYLDTFQPSTYTSIQNWNGPAVSAPPAVNKQNTSVQFGEIPLGYVMIGVNPADGSFPTSLTSPGVSIVSYGNAFDMISAMIGQDVLLPLQPTDVNAALVQPVTGSALRQGYSAKVVGANTAPTLVRPAYGTPAPGGSGTRSDSPFSTYRQPNFLKDGVPVLEALRRLDVILRQWLNFTGKQDLVSITQDGGALPLQATLDQILQKFDGGISTLTNLNTVAWPNGATGPDPANHVLKEGLITHTENTLLGKLGTAEGDSIRSALAALDVALSLVLTDVLGQSIPRSQLRDASGATFVPATFDERPEGRPALAETTQGGTAVTIYQTTQTLRQVLTEILSRTLSGQGVNWLANYGFWAGDLDSGNQATPPQFWSINGGTGTWTRAEHMAGGITGKVLSVALGANATFDQIITGAAADNFLGSALRSASHVSFAAVIQNLSAQGIRVEILGYSDTAATIGVFSSISDLIPQGSAARLVTGTFAIGPTDVINAIKFRIVSDTIGNPCSFAIAGASLNAGMPMSVASLCTVPTDFLSRDGGAQKQMRGPLYMGTKQVKNAADATDPQDLTTLNQVTTAIAVETAARITAVSAEQTRATNAESALNTAITNETSRAVGVENTKQPNATYDGTAYVSPIMDNIGTSVRLNVAGVDRFLPSWPTAAGPCHSNCHSNCNHSDCGRGSW